MTTWSLDRLRAIFRAYADVDFPTSGAPLYAAIADKLADDDDLLALAATTREGQPPPNLIFAAVHYLLLSGVEHTLRTYYPDLTPDPAPAADAFPHFRNFCLEHRDEVTRIIQSRLVQTNVLERSALLLPGFASEAAPLNTTEFATIEIGASAGLNLLWDRYHYSFAANAYGDVTWGDDESPVAISIDVRDERALPPIPSDLRATWRIGVDLDPVDLADEDAVLWQRALIWPERIDRQHRLQAAREMMLASPVQVVKGDAVQLLPSLLAEAPTDVPLVVFASYTLYQFPKEARARVVDLIAAHARTHPTALITLGTLRMGEPHGTLELTLFNDGQLRTTALAHGHPHGVWIEWLV